MRISFFKFVPLALACSLVAGPSFAQNPFSEREPGLWEITMTKNTAMAAMMQGMQDAMKNMPEAQRKQMEQMMAGSGVNLAQPDIFRQCLTPEMAKREIEPTIDDPDMDCSDVKWSTSGQEGKFSMACSSPDGDWTVQGRIWDATVKSYQSEMTMQGTVDGRNVSIDMAHEAKWVGSDCEGVKPAL